MPPLRVAAVAAAHQTCGQLPLSCGFRFLLRILMGKRDKEAQTEEEAVKMVFNALSHPRFAKLSLDERFNLADILVTERMKRQPGGWETLLGGIVYLLCLAIPLYFAFDILRTIFGQG